MTGYNVNLTTGATTTYQDFSFNSLCLAHDGNSYGLTSAGLFRLDGGTDDTSEIRAMISLGKQDLGTHKMKLRLLAYADLSSAANMVLRINLGAEDYDYSTQNYGEVMQQQRFDIAMGLRSNWFRFSLMNSEGCDFTLASLDIKADASKTRRI